MRKARPYSKTRGQVRARIGRDAALRRPDQIRIGISGWRYAKWRGKFYPKGLAHRRELEYASRFYFQRQGRAFHHPHEKTARCRNSARQLFWVGPSCVARKARCDPLAIAAELGLERGTIEQFFR